MTYTVWFALASSECIFVSGVPSFVLAETIAEALINEGFVTVAWIEAE